MIEYEKDAIVHPDVTEYIRNTLKKNDGFLLELETKARENGVPIVQPETAKFLETLIMIKKPFKILEIGCAVGYSAILMAKSAPNVHISTIEFDENMAKTAEENVEKAGFSDRIDVIYADARDYVSYIEDDEIFDLIFMDGPKAHYLSMLDDCMRMLKVGGVLLCDNIMYKGMTSSDDLVIKRKITIVKRLRKFLDTLTLRDDMETSILSVGDGITVSVKKY